MTMVNIQSHFKPHNSAKKHHIALSAVILSLFILMGWVGSVGAQGTVQISGIGYADTTGVCNDSPVDAQGDTPDFATVLTGDLEGCQYVFVDSWSCTPSGVYQERGTEYYVVDGKYGAGTFTTTYFFKGKFEGCTADGFPDGAEIFGFCQHPITAGSGGGAYEGVTGRLHFKDDVDAGNFPYTGHLKW